MFIGITVRRVAGTLHDGGTPPVAEPGIEEVCANPAGLPTIRGYSLRRRSLAQRGERDRLEPAGATRGRTAQMRGIAVLGVLIIALPIMFALGSKSDNVAGVYLICCVLFLVVGVPAFILMRLGQTKQQVDELKKTGFNIAYEVDSGAVRLCFDAERREFALVDGKQIQRFPYEQLDQWKYSVDGRGRLTLMIATRDPKRPLYRWGATGGQRAGENWMAQLNAIVNG